MKDFSTKTVKALESKGVTIIGSQAIPAFEGDRYFSGVAYQLNAAGQMIIRTHAQVVTMAKSSWVPGRYVTGNEGGTGHYDISYSDADPGL